jgi:hypothetical protein
VADALKREPGVEVQLLDGGKGEFTVLVDGRQVAKKGESLPPVEEVVAAVTKAGQAPAGTHA